MHHIVRGAKCAYVARTCAYVGFWGSESMLDSTHPCSSMRVFQAKWNWYETEAECAWTWFLFFYVIMYFYGVFALLSCFLLFVYTCICLYLIVFVFSCSSFIIVWWCLVSLFVIVAHLLILLCAFSVWRRDDSELGYDLVVFMNTPFMHYLWGVERTIFVV